MNIEKCLSESNLKKHDKIWKNITDTVIPSGVYSSSQCIKNSKVFSDNLWFIYEGDNLKYSHESIEELLTISKNRMIGDQELIFYRFDKSDKSKKKKKIIEDFYRYFGGSQYFCDYNRGYMYNFFNNNTNVNNILEKYRWNWDIINICGKNLKLSNGLFTPEKWCKEYLKKTYNDKLNDFIENIYEYSYKYKKKIFGYLMGNKNNEYEKFIDVFPITNDGNYTVTLYENSNYFYLVCNWYS